MICIHFWSDSQVICIGSNLVNTESNNNNYWSSSKLGTHEEPQRLVTKWQFVKMVSKAAPKAKD